MPLVPLELRLLLDHQTFLACLTPRCIKDAQSDGGGGSERHTGERFTQWIQHGSGLAHKPLSCVLRLALILLLNRPHAYCCLIPYSREFQPT